MRLYIRAFADSQAEVYRDIRGKSSVVIEHLIKIFLYPNSINSNHWKIEVAGALSRVPKLKRIKRYPEAKNIMKYSWKIWEDSICDMISEIVKEYGQPEHADFKSIYDKIHEYLAWISEELSKYGYVSNNKIYNEIQSLL